MLNTSVKRLMNELLEIQRHPSDDFRTEPSSESNLFEWHFTIRGAPDSPFSGGLYHGRIVLPEDYPKKPPDIYMLTPNGRFQVGEKICLSNTSFHKESWSPVWNIQMMLKALIAFFPTDSNGVGALQYTDEQKKQLALTSKTWTCPVCKKRNCDILSPSTPVDRDCAHSNMERQQPQENNRIQPTVKGNADISTSVHSDEAVVIHQISNNGNKQQTTVGNVTSATSSADVVAGVGSDPMKASQSTNNGGDIKPLSQSFIRKDIMAETRAFVILNSVTNGLIVFFLILLQFFIYRKLA